MTETVEKRVKRTDVEVLTAVNGSNTHEEAAEKLGLKSGSLRTRLTGLRKVNKSREEAGKKTFYIKKYDSQAGAKKKSEYDWDNLADKFVAPTK